MFSWSFVRADSRRKSLRSLDSPFTVSGLHARNHILTGAKVEGGVFAFPELDAQRFLPGNADDLIDTEQFLLDGIAMNTKIVHGWRCGWVDAVANARARRRVHLGTLASALPSSVVRKATPAFRRSSALHKEAAQQSHDRKVSRRREARMAGFPQ